MQETFILGEERWVSLEIKSLRGEDFVILSGKWELFLDGKLESSGDTRIDQHIISALISPSTPYKYYDLVFTYLIGNETLKSLVKIEVVKV